MEWILSRLRRRLDAPRTKPADLAALRRQRAHLSRLDLRLLGDIGISPDEAEAEARRALWDVPDSWRR